ncbi:MAG: hypothetical protein AAGM22_25385 [Acidobacteriota bacterium]
MTHKTLPSVLLSSLLLCLLSTSADARTMGSDADGPARLISFQLEDQFGETLSTADLEGRAVLVIAADGSASDFTGAWSAALGDAIAELKLTEKIDVIGLADQRRVPSFIRGTVRESFSSDPADATLLDWKGAFAKAYDFKKKHCNILLFTADGVTAHQAAVREMDEGVLSGFVTALGAF